MRKVFLSIAAAAAVASCAYAADQSTIILDLSKSTTELTFNAENGSWTGTYDDDAESIESQCFSFLHSSMADWQTWWGFTASNSTDNKQPENTLTHQWSNMAAGGILLNEDGTVKLDDFGAPVVGKDMPYLVAFYSPFMSARPVDMVFNDGKLYDPQSVYVNLNSYSFYSILLGDGFARAFTNDDAFTLTIHGVAGDESEKTVEVSMASCANGDLTTAKGWKYVDLTPLGTVNELYFTLTTTDTGAYGANTPLYFCLDKLAVTPAEGSAAGMMTADQASISYDRASKTISVDGADFAAVYDSLGAKVFQSDDSAFSIASLPAGVYVVKAGNSSIKIVR
ncbi:MAG: DUF4465 domain-containing protein [Muribaculaceae bacterium]|nr:DUF4465 domain-containing protein [Muribaculaceae bacterium]